MVPFSIKIISNIIILHLDFEYFASKFVFIFCVGAVSRPRPKLQTKKQ